MRKTVDLSQMSDDDLIRLNHEIIALLKARERLNSRRELMPFDLGENVTFKSPDGRRMRGTIVRVNQKSLTIATDHGVWRLPPCFVSKAKAPAKADGAKLLQLNRPGAP